MMYNNKLVCSVKANGKYLREDVHGDESIVYLPFKTEYSLLLKNLASRRALVHVDIDGKCQSMGGLILNAGQSLDLERPANLSSGRKFKFIEKTQEISEFRGDNPEDGLVVVKWQFERPAANIFVNPYTTPIWLGGTADWLYRGSSFTSGPSIGCTNTGTFSAKMNSNEPILTKCCVDNASPNVGENFIGYAAAAPQGITVEGSKSNQNFSSGYIGNLEGTLYSMVIKLYGGPRPIYVRERIECPTCGRRWKSTFEFCPNCGTAIK